MTQAGKDRRYSFGDFTLDVDRGALLSGGTEIRLRRQSFEVLRYLVQSHGRLVSKDELHKAIWGDTIVTDGSLTQCLIDVRRALGDESRRVIRTVPRRGYIFDAPVAAAAAAAAAPSAMATTVSRRWPVAFVTAFIVAAATVWLVLRVAPSDATAPSAPPNSIAVLPFADMSEAQDQEYFSEGIAEEILTTLAQSPDLHVIARTSSFSFKGKGADIATIADTLNVAYVLEGSVRRSGDRVRISAQLVDTSTSTNLWSEIFDRELTDVFIVQRDIAAAVADALEATRSGIPPAPANAEVFELYLQGRFFHNRRSSGDSEIAESYYRRALAVDPEYGRAWAGLAGTYIVRIFDKQENTEATRAAWKEAVEMALEHAPGLAETHVRAAQYYWHSGDDERWREHRGRALALGPHDPLVLTSQAGIDAFRGRLDDAIERYRRAIDLDPLSAVSHGNFAQILLAAGALEEALVEQRKALELNPSFGPQFEVSAACVFILQNRFEEASRTVNKWPEGLDREAVLAMIHYALGRSADAEKALAKLIARAEADPSAELSLRIAEVHAFRGDSDAAIRWLARGRESVRGQSRWARSERIHYVRLSPFLIPLRDDPRWEAIVAWED